MKYRACPRCQEALPREAFFAATNSDPMHTPLCAYCLGVFPRQRKRRDGATMSALLASRALAARRGWTPIRSA